MLARPAPAAAPEAPPVNLVQSVPIAPPAAAPPRRQGRGGARAANPAPRPRHLQGPRHRARTETAGRAHLARLCIEDLAGGQRLQAPQHPPRGDADRGAAARRISRQCRLRPFQSHQEDQSGERPLARGNLRPQHRRAEACRRAARRRAPARERRQIRHPVRRGGSVRQSPDDPPQRQARHGHQAQCRGLSHRKPLWRRQRQGPRRRDGRARQGHRGDHQADRRPRPPSSSFSRSAARRWPTPNGPSSPPPATW